MDRALRCLCSFEEMARVVVTRAVADAPAGAVLVDATAGNGHDTLFLARLAQRFCGEVLAFDVQSAALQKTQALLADAGCSARLVYDSHARMQEYVRGRVAVVMFNLGFLPGSDKSVVTGTEHTLAALRAAGDLLQPHGIISIHAYTGHAGGQEETEAVRHWARNLPRSRWRVQETIEGNRAGKAECLWLLEKIADESKKYGTAC